MTDEPPKLKRKRWRWILAGVLLFVVAGGGWWWWPRGDARFVGKWEIRFGDWADAQKMFDVTFHRNGSMTLSPEQFVRTPFRSWRIEHNQLVWGFQLPQPKSAFSKQFARSMRILTQNPVWGMQDAFPIIEVGVSKIRLETSDKPAAPWILTRLPE